MPSRLRTLRVVLLAACLYVAVKAYSIDPTCRNYGGGDISNDIQKAVDEVQEMAGDAFAITLTEDESTNHLLEVLFSTDRSRHDTVRGYFSTFHSFSPTQDFVVICDDQTVQLEQDFTPQRPLIAPMAGMKSLTTLRLVTTQGKLVLNPTA
ncbi:MAG: hypothetical protein Q9222_000253 [Ikaeria aurantiellina]